MSSNLLLSGPPPRVTTRKPNPPSQAKKKTGMVEFKPPKQEWKDCVQNLVKSSPINSPLAAKWAHPQSISAASPAVATPVSGDTTASGSSSNGSPANVLNKENAKASPVTGASANTTPSSSTSRVPLTFSLHQDGFGSNDLEIVLGSGHCQVVPSKNEALSFISTVTLKIHEKNGGFLALRSEPKGDKIHNVLDIDKPVLDGQYCVVKAKSQQWPYHLRFDANEHVKAFKDCLSKLRKAVRVHQKPENENEPQAAKAEVTESSSEVNKTDDNAAKTVEKEELIVMDDDWDSSNNPQVPIIQSAVNPMVMLVRQCLEYFSAEDSFCAGTIAGIEDAILDKWIGEGFLKDCDEKQKEASLAMLRTFVEVELILTGKKMPGKTSESSTSQVSNSQAQGAAPGQASGSAGRPGRGTTQGLGSSCFAKKPFSCAGAFTGPRSRHPPYK